MAEKTRSSILKQWSMFVPSHVMDPPQVILTTELEVQKTFLKRHHTHIES